MCTSRNAVEGDRHRNMRFKITEDAIIDLQYGEHTARMFVVTCGLYSQFYFICLLSGVSGSSVTNGTSAKADRAVRTSAAMGSSPSNNSAPNISIPLPQNDFFRQCQLFESLDCAAFEDATCQRDLRKAEDAILHFKLRLLSRSWCCMANYPSTVFLQLNKNVLSVYLLNPARGWFPRRAAVPTTDRKPANRSGPRWIESRR